MYVQNPSIEKSGATHSAIASIRTLIAKYASPSVSRISGSASSVRIGLTIAFAMPNTAAPMSTLPQQPDLHAVEDRIDDEERDDVDSPPDEERSQRL